MIVQNFFTDFKPLILALSIGTFGGLLFIRLLDDAPSLDAGVDGLCYDRRDLRMVSEITICLETMYGCLYRRYARLAVAHETYSTD